MKTLFLILAACAINARAQNTSTVAVKTQTQTPNVLKIAEEMPEFPGGAHEQIKYFNKHLLYPQIAKDSAYSGTAYIRFIVDTIGKITEATLLKGVPRCPDCDRAALMVVKAMPHWKPGKQNGKAVNVYYTLPVRFIIH